MPRRQARPSNVHPFKLLAKDYAKHQSDSNKTDSDRERGGGDSVVINGTPWSLPGAMANVSGVRPDVGGTYLITAVEHTLNRHSGFLTHLPLRQPSGDAGKDDRQADAA